VQLNGLMPLGIPLQVVPRLLQAATIAMQSASLRGGGEFQTIHFKMVLILPFDLIGWINHFDGSGAG
jgi:hypothetical protein